LHVLAPATELLMYMPPHSRLHLWTAIHNGQEGVCITQDILVNPGAAHREGLVVQHHHHMAVCMVCQRLFEEIQFRLLQIAINLLRYRRVQQDDDPGPQIYQTPLRRVGDSKLAHHHRGVVVAGYPGKGNWKITPDGVDTAAIACLIAGTGNITSADKVIE